MNEKEPLTSDREVQRLRKAQARLVMPLIGPLLDAYDGLPNDIRSDPELEPLFDYLRQIDEAMELAE